MLRKSNITSEEAKQEFIIRDLIPLFDKYKNSKEKLLAQTKEGYLVVVTLNKLKLGRTPRIFDKSNPYTIQNIKLWCELNNKKFKLLSEEYNGAFTYLQWKCLKEDCGEIFEMSWNNIFSNKNNCSYCAGKKVGLFNCLATKKSELASEWHPIKNGNLTPYDVTCGSHKKVWWKCNECGHEWKSFIYSRNNSNCCPECNKSKGEKECKRIFDLNNIYYIPQKEFAGLFGLCNGLLSYDFYLPQYNLLIEYQGEFHDGSSGEYSKINLMKQQEHDKRKKEYAKYNNINLLEIWYWDFDNVEYILDQYFKEGGNNGI